MAKCFNCMYRIVSGHVENRPDSSPLILYLHHLFCVAMAVVSCLDHSDATIPGSIVSSGSANAVVLERPVKRDDTVMIKRMAQLKARQAI